MKKIYITGPDVFLPKSRYQKSKEKKISVCRKYGFEALHPLDDSFSTAEEIADANFALIDKCDIIVANANPFRGQEPDSGTMCEIGYGIANKKQIICYIDDITPMYDKYGSVDQNGDFYENFGYPINLMIASKAIIIKGGFEDAIKYAQANA